jgi:hypothetical protein
MLTFRVRVRDLILPMEGKRRYRPSPLMTCSIAVRAVVATIAFGLNLDPVCAGDPTPELVAKAKSDSDFAKPQPSVATEPPSELPRVDQTPPNPSQANPNDTAGRRLRAAATEYILSGGSPSLEREMMLYAEHVVDYYDEGAKSADEIRADISKLRSRWPSRHYEISRIVRTQYDPKNDVGTVVVDYTFEVSNGAKRKTGEVETFLVFNTVSKQPRVILVNEHNVNSALLFQSHGP